jgi:isopentenyl-diphosphate delta-isomerase
MINKDELLFVVDENNNPVEPRPRHEVHAKGFWHRNSHVWIANSKKEILCQKRSMKKDKKPGFWEAFFGGHLHPGMDYLEGADKEAKEELNIDFDKKDLIPFQVFKSEEGREFISIYLLKWDGDASKIKFEEDEIDELKWVGFEKLKKILILKKDPHWTDLGYNKIMLTWLEKETD